MRGRTLAVILFITLLPIVVTAVFCHEDLLSPVLLFLLLPAAAGALHAVGLWLSLPCRSCRIAACGLHAAVTLGGCIAAVLLVLQHAPGLAALWALAQCCLAVWASRFFMKIKRAAGFLSLAAAGCAMVCAVLMGLYAAGVLFL